MISVTKLVVLFLYIIISCVCLENSLSKQACVFFKPQLFAITLWELVFFSTWGFCCLNFMIICTKFYWYSLKNHSGNLEELDFGPLTFYMYLIVHVFGRLTFWIRVGNGNGHSAQDKEFSSNTHSCSFYWSHPPVILICI